MLTSLSYLVTGAAGFIGFFTAQRLLENGHEVIGIDNLNDYYDTSLKYGRLQILKKYSRFRFFKIDLCDLLSLRQVFDQHKVYKVCHLAAQAGVRYSLNNPYVYQKSNLEGFFNILELSKQRNVANFVYASSSSVYGENKVIPFGIQDRVDTPVSLYAATKRANELLAYTYSYQFGLPTTGLRFFTVYGPWGRPDMAYYKFTEAILFGQEIEIYNYGHMARDFTYIEDIVEGIIAALDRNFNYEIFNLGNSNPVTLEHFIACLEEIIGKKARKKYLPIQPGDVVKTYADITYSTEKLNYVPKTNIYEGLKRFVHWYRGYKNF